MLTVSEHLEEKEQEKRKSISLFDEQEFLNACV